MWDLVVSPKWRMLRPAGWNEIGFLPILWFPSWLIYCVFYLWASLHRIFILSWLGVLVGDVVSRPSVWDLAFGSLRARRDSGQLLLAPYFSLILVLARCAKSSNSGFCVILVLLRISGLARPSRIYLYDQWRGWVVAFYIFVGFELSFPEGDTGCQIEVE